MPTGRLLILDDDLIVAQTIAFIAEDAGLDTRLTTDPETFFREFAQWHPTHIALDLIMPHMDGVEVMRLLAEHQCRAKIIITSGVGGRVLDAAGRSAAEHGLDLAGVLPKPFSPAHLRVLLRENHDDSHGPTKLALSHSPTLFEINEAEINRALEQHEFQLVYQPKVDCRTGIVEGFEALVRWHHPDVGLIMPDRFIPFAEHSDQIGALTEHIIELSIKWLAHYFPESSLRLAINISAKSLGDFLLVDRLSSIANQHAIDPSRLIIELTETSAMDDPITSLDLLTRFRMKGFHLSIDDFGTGYSSMVQLVRLPFTEIKIDKSFVMVAMHSQESRMIIKSIIDLSHSLEIRATAEGVEDQPTLEFLTRIGCDLVQGYFISRPMAGELAANWIETWDAACLPRHRSLLDNPQAPSLLAA